jgi:hypothetical protein
LCSESVETTVYEFVFHWYKGLLSDAGFDRAGVIAERKVYKIACAAALLDFRKLVDTQTDLLHRTDYTLCQLMYRLEETQVVVEKCPGSAWFKIPIDTF